MSSPSQPSASQEIPSLHSPPSTEFGSPPSQSIPSIPSSSSRIDLEMPHPDTSAQSPILRTSETIESNIEVRSPSDPPRAPTPPSEPTSISRSESDQSLFHHRPSSIHHNHIDHLRPSSSSSSNPLAVKHNHSVNPFLPSSSRNIPRSRASSTRSPTLSLHGSGVVGVAAHGIPPIGVGVTTTSLARDVGLGELMVDEDVDNGISGGGAEDAGSRTGAAATGRLESTVYERLTERSSDGETELDTRYASKSECQGENGSEEEIKVDCTGNQIAQDPNVRMNRVLQGFEQNVPRKSRSPPISMSIPPECTGTPHSLKSTIEPLDGTGGVGEPTVNYTGDLTKREGTTIEHLRKGLRRLMTDDDRNRGREQTGGPEDGDGEDMDVRDIRPDASEKTLPEVYKSRRKGRGSVTHSSPGPSSEPPKTGIDRNVASSQHLQMEASVTSNLSAHNGAMRNGTASGSTTTQLTRPCSRPRQYYILTNAGKPVFSSVEEEARKEDAEGLSQGPPAQTMDNSGRQTRMMGVVQAIISIYAEEDEKIRSISHGNLKISFLLRPPLYLFCVSDHLEPSYVLRTHLEYLYMQILSTTTRSSLLSVFAKRSNFDLRRLIEGTEGFLRRLIRSLQDDFSMLTSSLQPLRLDPAIRTATANALLPSTKEKHDDLLYVIVLAGSKVVTLLRPRRHSIHPLDLHLLINMLQASPALRSDESWLPFCLPKYNPDRFVYAYFSYLQSDVGLIFLSKNKDGFETCRSLRESVNSRFSGPRTADHIALALQKHAYDVEQFRCPGLIHFFYKSRSLVQTTSPRWQEPYASSGDAKIKAMTLYQDAYDAIHAKSGSGPQLRQIYLHDEDLACFGWISQTFEVYVLVDKVMSKSAVTSTVNTVVKWVKKEDVRLFLKEAPVF